MDTIGDFAAMPPVDAGKLLMGWRRQEARAVNINLGRHQHAPLLRPHSKEGLGRVEGRTGGKAHTKLDCL